MNVLFAALLSSSMLAAATGSEPTAAPQITCAAGDSIVLMNPTTKLYTMASPSPAQVKQTTSISGKTMEKSEMNTPAATATATDRAKSALDSSGVPALTTDKAVTQNGINNASKPTATAMCKSQADKLGGRPLKGAL